ncbi:hypothetical protein CSKR_101544 [Clonorchis sinensis]|uniref:Uncharacterized protein n=1 Tax=Clonorchis sinensis TaxID=79923 RepID=A0A3R7GF06_CLOSI|nr:hypothetical protein CSKR_101544 [Clonorchis sinensis]
MSDTPGSLESSASTGATPMSPVSPISKEQHVMQRTLSAITSYLDCNVEGALLEFSLLRRLNEASTNHFAELNGSANEIARKLTDVNERYLALESSLRKLDEFDTKIRQLEDAAAAVEQYTKQLGKQRSGKASPRISSR